MIFSHHAPPTPNQEMQRFAPDDFVSTGCPSFSGRQVAEYLLAGVLPSSAAANVSTPKALARAQSGCAWRAHSAKHIQLPTRNRLEACSTHSEEPG